MTPEGERLETWDVEIGPSAREFIDGIDFLDTEDRKEGILRESSKILSRCSNPIDSVSRKCLLVLGEVQSGKTLSFTSVIALSRDNGIPFTIVLAGTKRPLMRQNYEQLALDLTRSSFGTAPKWYITTSLKSDSEAVILRALSNWFMEDVPEEFKQSVVIASMKTPAGISKVTTFLSRIQKTVGRTFPVLIIDDEGDQASPNTKVALDEFSATYDAISNLRDAVPNHSFLSYTATPEANLLLSLKDHLSPEGVVVLNPGIGYVGGYKLFVDRGFSNKFRIEIPDNELGVARRPQFDDMPPLSLQSALAYFLVAMTIAQKGAVKVRPISMLIHPDSTIDSHSKYKKWIVSIRDKWSTHFRESTLEEPDYRPPKEFVSAIEQLRTTIPHLEEIMETVSISETQTEILKLIRFWIHTDYLEVRIVNSEKASHNVSPSEWSTKAGWILIGAGKLDRGFVVKNLAVTYMPRGIGGGNIDTIQQRGRFFGYKSHYLELLRGWFSSELVNAYAGIVETEDALRKQLRKYDIEGLNLAGWERAMIMDPSLTPTRKNIISLSHTTLNLRSDTWYQQRRLFDPVLFARAKDLRPVLEGFMKEAVITALDTRDREEFKHKVCRLSLPETVNLLFDWPMASADREILNKYLIVLANLASDQTTTSVELFFMNQLENRERRVARLSRDANPKNPKLWNIQNLHEGPRTNSNSPYFGDKSVKNSEAISIQIHSVIPYDNESGGSRNDRSCFALALAWPDGFERKVLKQTRW
jgi:hypothetical protein